MIIIDDLGINISVKYIGDNITDCKEFISYMISIEAHKKPKGPDWIVSKDHFEDIKSKFEYTIKINPWDSIGTNMKSESQQEKRERLKAQSNKKKQDVKKVDKEVKIVQSLKDQHPSIYKR